MKLKITPPRDAVPSSSAYQGVGSLTGQTSFEPWFNNDFDSSPP
jgi:hypothetical protein